MRSYLTTKGVTDVVRPTLSNSAGIKVRTRMNNGLPNYLSVSGETRAELYNVLSQYGINEGGETDLFSTHCCECAEIIYSEEK